MPLRSPLLLAAALAAPAPAQVAPVTTATPTPSATIPAEASAVPPPIAIALPTPAATSAAPPARPTPAPAAIAAERVRPAAATTPLPRSSPTPEAAAPTPTPTPTAAVTPQAQASPAVDLSAPPVVPAGAPATALPLPPERGSPWMLPTVGGLLIALALVALAARRRRRAAGAADRPVEAAAPTPSPRPTPPSAPAAPRGWLALDLRARRAGVNLLTATLDAEVVVRNEGDAAAEDIRVVLRLTSARSDQEAELEAAATDPAARPIAAPFALAPGEERAIGAIATLPRGEIAVMTVGDRPMFVPVAAIGARYVSGEIAGQSATAVALGVERAGTDKLAPFWLDVPAQMHDAVGVRPHGLSVRR